MLREIPGFVFASLLVTASCACADDVAVAGPGDRSALELADDDPASLGSVAPFRFDSSDGRVVSEADLRNRVWVVDFFFTTCSGPCPVITAQMCELQKELAGSNVLLVSVSVDPSIDTPEVLREYASRVGADSGRWWFLTGDEAATFELIRSSFALQVERVNEALLGFQVSHATRLVVVDGRGKVRGYYPGETDAGRAMARTRALWLSTHPDS